MVTRITVSEDKHVDLSQTFIGYQDERNVDSIILNLSRSIPDMNWYLLFDGALYPFEKNKLVVNEYLTSQRGRFSCRIIGTDGARKGNNITMGKYYFKSDAFELEVI